MSSKQKSVFIRSKPILNIYSSVDNDGKEVEVREDAEQLVKWHEISDALVAAGYYRAQVQGLSAFDKIVGGLSWCIELCDIDVDISLLFEENLTIGKKIALTEKIVKVLPSMKCPHIIEPHQIQGLDFINIFPLVQWLIKYSSEFREAKEDELRKFAVMQYERDHIFESDRNEFHQKEKLLRNLCLVQNLYKPCRVRKRKGAFPSNELEQVNATLSEFDQRQLINVSTSYEGINKDDGLDFIYDYEKALADPTDITTETEIFRNSNEVSKGTTNDSKIHYAVLQSELTGEISEELEQSERIKYSKDIDRLTRIIELMEEELNDLKIKHDSRMEITKKHYSDVIEKFQKITSKMMKSDENSDKNIKDLYKTLKDLAKERRELLAVAHHKDDEYKKLQNELKSVQNSEAIVQEDPLTPEELKEIKIREDKIKEFIGEMRLELGKLNREIMRYNRAIDDVPGPAELLQYEKRFMELYNQVALKHKETKQYYISYNTFYEVKLYTSKELSLLNSILDNYEEAMSSPRRREEFMTQFESIVDWVNQTVKKVETKFNQEKTKKADLHAEYSRLIDIQRQYAAALKKLAEERQKIGRKR